ncbi:ABC transporter ATP-binding protein [Cyclobacterium sp.]|uniref:ABC transporter ATP-binding protein n=1 Tax=Cyclobacterium sp. TaxID=1966343 RepID=UPI0019CE0D7A|nr:ABC transporter ATP-binding protein [Cyclobacterium sp.]MBD3626583.1 ABC transporter ATP-binding protein [Cyclobacterium sp.]
MGFLSIEKLSKTYEGPTTALADFSMEIGQGDRWSVVGASGSGKSTLLRLIAGLEAQDEGAVFLKGERILHSGEKLVPGYDAIQLVKQDKGLYPNSTVAENISRPLLQYDKVYASERLDELLGLFGLEEKKDRLPRQLSGGQQQKVAIARAMSLEPEILLLDEPFSSLDSHQKRDLLDELNLIFQDLDITLVLVTHDIQEALLITDKLCVMAHGRLLRKGRIKDIHQDPKTAYVAGFFGPLNALSENQYLRPSQIQVTKKKGKAAGKILLKRYFPDHDLLTVALEGQSNYWQVAAPFRGISKGDSVNLDWEESHILRLAE